MFVQDLDVREEIAHQMSNKKGPGCLGFFRGLYYIYTTQLWGDYNYILKIQINQLV